MLDFLLQIDLTDISLMDPTGDLPKSGLLSFFYDLENQPWGFDPKEQDGFKVEFFPEQHFIQGPPPDPAYKLNVRRLIFSHIFTIPSFGSRSFDRLKQENHLNIDEIGRYIKMEDEYYSQFYKKGCCYHRLFGHSDNIQGDMQLEAQLVSNGINCGYSSGYKNKKAKTLESGSDEWQLLLQLDSDDSAELMWGDVGMLYFWVRKEDLKKMDYQHVWMTLQCC
jgi:uncharacterized protein YwqG